MGPSMMPGWLIWMKDMVVKRIDSSQTSSMKSKATGMVVLRVHITTISGGSVQPVMDAIMTTTGVTGPGITQALKSLGSTGLIMNQMIGTVRTVSLTSPSLIHSASMPLTGMTGTVNKRQDTSVKRLELK